MTELSFDVVGIGNAIVDVLTQADDALVDAQGLPKGSMTLIDGHRAEDLYAQMGPAREISGGSPLGPGRRSLTDMAHEACGLGAPFTSTRHMRQLPAIDRRSW